MLAKCVNCGFYVGSNEKICPDCGLSAPNAPVKFNPGDFNRPLIFKLTAIIAIVIYAAIILFRVREGNNDFSDLFGLLAIIALISLAVSVFAAPFITYRSTKNEKQQRLASMETATNFRFIENTILLRNHELKEKLREFRSSPKRGVRLSDDAKKSKTPPQKIEILNLIARYDLLSSKFDYAKFENQLLPIIEKRNTPENGEDFSETLDEIRSEIELINSSLTDDSAPETSEIFQAEKQNLLAQIEKTERICEALPRRRNDADPFHDSSEKSLSANLMRRTSSFNIQTTLVNFLESFDELEREYWRLKTNRR